VEMVDDGIPPFERFRLKLLHFVLWLLLVLVLELMNLMRMNLLKLFSALALSVAVAESPVEVAGLDEDP
jgi:hypothetical protein